MLNGSFLDYRMPVCLDLPMLDIVLVEVPNPNHPYGVRGVGEVPIVPPMAAIANAMYRAIGVGFNRLPMSPGRVLEALVVQGVSRNGAHSHAVRGTATNGTTERHSENGVQEERDGVHTPGEVLTERLVPTEHMWSRYEGEP